MQRFLDPAVLASISGLDLVAKTIVQGFIAGLHRSPEHGFSQEFAEYRAYTPGDDLRYVDWNAFARTERCYLKRYRGETNTQLTVLLDASASMGFGSHRVNKIDYARYLAASLLYLANRQRDAAGLIVFDDEVRNCIAPSSRHGQLSRLLHGIEGAEPRARTDYAKPFVHLQNLLHRRGLVAVISDFYAPPDDVIRTMEPLALRGNELMLFHVLDPEEIQPTLREPGLLVDMETDDSMEVSPEYARTEYRHKIDAHIEALRDKARRSGMDYFLLRTNQPLDQALREYLTVREGKY
ncbi:MAG TPA: DUF58 domain-containing protein [Bryobacteraceae bacterium]|mgnify:FL=1|nr:DUF58 domain-containing protein [Bryobacteraceae bacterium]HPU72202.1 DUF58 domain-containing protein [Bryobacteraceae bacterium]